MLSTHCIIIAGIELAISLLHIAESTTFCTFAYFVRWLLPSCRFYVKLPKVSVESNIDLFFHVLTKWKKGLKVALQNKKNMHGGPDLRPELKSHNQ